jgi:hypothetical protein
MERGNKGDLHYKMSKAESPDTEKKVQSFNQKLEKRLRKTKASFKKLICDHPFWDEERTETNWVKKNN